MLIDHNQPRQFEGNLAHGSGEIYYAGDIIVNGSVSGKFRLVGDGDVIIEGDVIDTQVQAAGDLVINGTVSGSDQNMRLSAGGRMWLNSPTQIHARARNDIIVHGDVKKSHLYSDRQITIQEGIADDSVLFAAAGLWVASAISSTTQATKITVGISYSSHLRQQIFNESIKKLEDQQRALLKELGDLLNKHPNTIVATRNGPPAALKSKMSQLQTISNNLGRMREAHLSSENNNQGKMIVACEQSIGAGVTICVGSCCTMLAQPVVGPVSLFVDEKAKTVINRQPGMLIKENKKKYDCKKKIFGLPQ